MRSGRGWGQTAVDAPGADEVCDRFRRCLQASVGDFSLSPQPAGWALSRVSLLLQAKAKDRIEQLRPVEVVPTTQKLAASSMLAAMGDRIITARINAVAYRKGQPGPRSHAGPFGGPEGG